MAFGSHLPPARPTPLDDLSPGDVIVPLPSMFPLMRLRVISFPFASVDLFPTSADSRPRVVCLGGFSWAVIPPSIISDVYPPHCTLHGSAQSESAPAWSVPEDYLTPPDPSSLSGPLL